MQYSWRFQLAVMLMAVISAFAVMAAEYGYDASSATLNIFLSLILTFSALFGFSRSRRPLHWFGGMVIHVITFVCVLLFLWFLLGADDGPMQRAYMIARITIVIMACKFILAWRTRDYGQIFVFTLLLMVVAAVTCVSIGLVPIFILYMILSAYALVIYHLQRQVELVIRTRCIGWTPGPDDLERLRQETRGFWIQLGHGRFNMTCLSLIAVGLVLAGTVFMMFPRFETGSLLGSRFGQRIQSGFTDHVQLGEIDKSETLRQVVARVAVTRQGRSAGSTDLPYYLRCAALDQYWRCRIEENTLDAKPAQWTRSLLSYILQQPLATLEPEENTPGILEQDVLLNSWDNPYLPTIYPIQSIQTAEDLKLHIGRLDRIISCFNVNPNSLCYVGQSSYGVSSRQAFVGFKTQLEMLGQYWLSYGGQFDMGIGRSRDPSDPIHELAVTIAQSRRQERQNLSQDQAEAYRQWRMYRDMKNPAYQNVESIWDIYKLTRDDPNIVMDVQYHRNIQNIYDVSVRMADIDRGIARDIADYLRNNYRYAVVSQTPLVPARIEKYDEKHALYDPVSEFVAHPQSAGNCEMFASAMVLMCRSLGMQARLVVGYLAHEYVPDFGYYIIRQSDAHSWVELYTADQDWVLFDPTPVAIHDEKIARGKLGQFVQRMDHYFENLQYRWLKFTVSYQGQQTLAWADQATGWLEQLESSAQTLSESQAADRIRNWFTHQSGESFFALFVRWMIFFCILINIIIGIREIVTWLLPKYVRHRVHQKNLNTYQDETVVFYRQMLEILQRIHLYKDPHLTPREFAFHAIAHDPALAPVGKLSELYYRVRFGRLEIDEKKQETIDNALFHLQIFTKSVRKTLKRPWPWERTN